MFKRRQWPPAVFIVNFEHILRLFLVFLLLNLNKKMLAGLLSQDNNLFFTSST